MFGRMKHAMIEDLGANLPNRRGAAAELSTTDRLGHRKYDEGNNDAWPIDDRIR